MPSRQERRQATQNAERENRAPLGTVEARPQQSMPSRQERRQAARQAARDAGQQSETTSENVEETPQALAIRSLRAEAAESYRRSERDAKTRDPVTITTATHRLIVPPRQQRWCCSCEYGFHNYLYLPIGVEGVWKLDRHVVRGDIDGPFLNHHRYTCSGDNPIHWELKVHLILGLKGTDFCVEGSKIELVREDFYGPEDLGVALMSHKPETAIVTVILD